MKDILRIIENILGSNPEHTAKSVFLEIAQQPQNFQPLHLKNLSEPHALSNQTLLRVSFTKNRLTEYFWLIVIKSQGAPHVYALHPNSYNILYSRLIIDGDVQLLIPDRESFTDPSFLYLDINDQWNTENDVRFDSIELHLTTPGIPAESMSPQHPLLHVRFAT